MSSDRVTLVVSARGADEVGSRRVRRLRKEGLVPGVLYGKGHSRAILIRIAPGQEMELLSAKLGKDGTTVRLGPDVDLDFSEGIPGVPDLPSDFLPIFFGRCVTLTSASALTNEGPATPAAGRGILATSIVGPGKGVQNDAPQQECRRRIAKKRARRLQVL